MDARKKRRYTLRQRAAQKERTRARIVDATIALHQELGPRDTTITAIAERAGVQRLTVYRYFPDDTAVFNACTTRWLELSPPPQPSLWADESDPLERCRTALAAFCDYYRRTASMWRLAYRDVDAVPALQGPMARFEAFLDQVRDDLLRGWSPAPAPGGGLAASLGHCLRFGTWRSLDAQGLDDGRIVALMRRWISAAAGSP